MLSWANKGKGSVLIKQCLSSLAVQSKDKEHTVSVLVGTQHFVLQKDIILAVFSRIHCIWAFDGLLSSPVPPMPYYIVG